MSEIAPLPDLQDAVIDEATLDQLFFDIAQGAELLAIVYKGTAGAADAALAPPDLAAARGALRGDRVLGVQLRYRHAGVEWWDTLLRTARGVRLVRIAQR
jgi:hypothetical protein